MTISITLKKSCSFAEGALMNISYLYRERTGLRCVTSGSAKRAPRTNDQKVSFYLGLYNVLDIESGDWIACLVLPCLPPERSSQASRLGNGGVLYVKSLYKVQFDVLIFYSIGDLYFTS